MDVAGEIREDPGLLGELLGAGDRPRVERLELHVGRAHLQAARLVLVLGRDEGLLLWRLRPRRLIEVGLGQVIADEIGRALVEERLALHVVRGVERLVEHHVGELAQRLVAAADHRREHRVREPAQGRVGAGAAEIHVPAGRAQIAGEAARVVAIEEAEVGHAADDGEAPRPVAKAEGLRGRHHPDGDGAVEVGVGAVVAGRRQPLLLAEALDLLHAPEQRSEARRGPPVAHHLVDVAPGLEQIELPEAGLDQVARRGAAGERRQRREREERDEPPEDPGTATAVRRGRGHRATSTLRAAALHAV